MSKGGQIAEIRARVKSLPGSPDESSAWSPLLPVMQADIEWLLDQVQELSSMVTSFFRQIQLEKLRAEKAERRLAELKARRAP